MKKTMLLTLALMFSLVLKASDDPKTLPPAMYETMKSGKKLDKVFVDPAYGKQAGFKLGDVEYRAENMKPEVLDGIKKSLAMIVKSQSPFTLKLTVIKVSNTTFVGLGNVMGKVTVEGQIVDADGKVVVAFVTRESAELGGFGGGTNYQAACNKIVTAIAKDLL